VTLLHFIDPGYYSGILTINIEYTKSIRKILENPGKKQIAEIIE